MPLHITLENTWRFSDQQLCHAWFTLTPPAPLPALTVIGRASSCQRLEFAKPPANAREANTGDAAFEERFCTWVGNDEALGLLTDSVRARLLALREPDCVAPVLLLQTHTNLRLCMNVGPDNVGPGDPIYTEARMTELFDLLADLSAMRC
jgi:hypothetical protein